MNTVTQTAIQGATSIHPATTLGPVTLAVADAARSVRFYRDLLGLQVLADAGERVVLGAGATPLIELAVSPGIGPSPRRATGLYHAAILLPTRADLGHVLKRILEARYTVGFGASDHLVSEALYLSDPDNNGLEIYRDRPQSEWRYEADGTLMMDTRPLDAPGVLGELGSGEWPGMPSGTVLGHMHLRVADLDQAEAFYSGILGFDVMVRRYSGALFVSAGGYHHHLGLNTWESAGAAAPPANVAGLRSFTVVLPDQAARAAVVDRVVAAGLPLREAGAALAVDDPWGNIVLLAVAA